MLMPTRRGYSQAALPVSKSRGIVVYQRLQMAISYTTNEISEGLTEGCCCELE